MDEKEKAKLKKEAKDMLARARRTAKMKTLAHLRENKDGMLCHRNGVRYEEITDDLADMQGALNAAGLTLADIGTDEKELSKLKAASVRLNAPHSAKVDREQAARRARFDYDNE